MNKRPIKLPELPPSDGVVDGDTAAWTYSSLTRYTRAAVEADRAAIAAVLLEIYKAAGGDSECTPDPTPEELLACVRDLRECYNDALTWVPKKRIVVTDEDVIEAFYTSGNGTLPDTRAALESFARRIRGDSDVPSEPAVAGERLKGR
jgi:hypothetical protein